MRKEFKAIFNTTMLFTSFFLGVGCHNNAHLRTQRILEPGEKVLSGIQTVSNGGNPRWGYLDYTGIPGTRAEISFLKGIRNGEIGPYLGIGMGGAYELSFNLAIFVGYHYAKYLRANNVLPFKMGAQGEIVFVDGYDGIAWQIRPFFLSTTNKNNRLYGGFHGIIDYGKMDYYRHSTTGIGFTVGHEFSGETLSIQLQIDGTFLYSIYSSDEYDPAGKDDLNEIFTYGGKLIDPSRTAFMVSLSTGLNLFKPSRD